MAAAPLSIAQYCKILGVRSDCDESTLRAAYKESANKFHPDHGGSVEMFQMAQEAFAAITAHQHQQRWGTSNSTYGSQVKEPPKLIELRR